jgi:hypothetical protein
VRWILLWLALPAPAQFSSFVTTYDGSRLYFTSQLWQRGTDQPNHGKLFVADESGVRQLLIRNRDVTYYRDLGPGEYWSTNYYDIFGVEAPGDVSTLAVFARRYCNISSGMCYYSDQTQTTVYNSRGEEALKQEGRMRMSPDGKWALVTGGGPVACCQYVIELASGTRYEVPSTPYSNSATPAYPTPFDWQAHDIANNGTAAVTSGGALLVFTPPDKVRRLFGRPDSAVIDAAGRRVVWAEDEADSPSAVLRRRGLRLLELATGAAPVSLDTPGRDEFAPNISDDGSRILFLSRRRDTGDTQAFVMNGDGSGRRQITSEPDGIQSAVLSGNGAVAWLLTGLGRLIRLEVDRAASREVIGHPPAFVRSPNADYALAAHEDWSALVDANRPARQAEIVHIYATRLGPVTPPVPAGTAAPASPLSVLATPLSCRDRSGGVLDVLYAGLAPGTIGYYLISVRLPSASGQRLLEIHCELAGTFGAFTARLPVHE